MDTMAPRFVALAVVLICVVPALATDQDTFNQLIAKYAVDTSSGVPSPFKPKAACACMSSLPAVRGFVTQQFGQLYCGVPSFDSSGALTSVINCQPFEAIGK